MEYSEQYADTSFDYRNYLKTFFYRIPLCSLINQFLSNLARKFPMTKFLKSISTTCIPNWPDSNVPTIFVYRNGEMVKQFIGPVELRGMKLTEEGKY